MSRLQERPLLESKASSPRQFHLLPQNVSSFYSYTSRDSLSIISFARCESCIDRLFTLGPAPCPICTKVLRKLAFTPQTFEDLVVEKEVAVRRRISKE